MNNKVLVGFKLLSVIQLYIGIISSLVPPIVTICALSLVIHGWEDHPLDYTFLFLADASLLVYTGFIIAKRRNLALLCLACCVAFCVSPYWISEFSFGIKHGFRLYETLRSSYLLLNKKLYVYFALVIQGYLGLLLAEKLKKIKAIPKPEDENSPKLR